MKLPLTAILAGFSAVRAQNQTIVTWFSTSTGLSDFSTWKVVQYGSAPVTPIPTVLSGASSETIVVREPTASRNINLTTWQLAQVTFPVKTRIATVVQTVLGLTTVAANGTSTVASYVYPTIATITFTPTVCADGGSPPKTTVTRYTGDYTPFPGQATSETRSSFPTAVTSYYRVISHRRVFAYTGTTVLHTSTATNTNYLTTTTLPNQTTTITSSIFRLTFTSYTATTTTTNINWSLTETTAPSPITTLCSPSPSPNATTTTTATATATVTRALRCAPSNLISEGDGRGVAVRLDADRWTYPSRPNTDLFREAFADPSVCCQLCVDNPGCAASEWRPRSWNDGCRLFYFHGRKWEDFVVGGNNGTGTVKGGGNGTSSNTCGGPVNEEVEYYGDSYRFPGQGSLLQIGCGGLRYIGGRDPVCDGCVVEG